MNLYQRLLKFGESLRVGAAAFRVAQRVDGLPKAQQATAAQFVKNVQAWGAAIRTAAPEKNLGVWQPIEAMRPVNDAAVAALRSRDARYAHTTSGAGQEPVGMAPYPEITLGVIASAQRMAHRTGWVIRKADIDTRYLRDSSHLGAVDRKLRGWAYKAPFRVLPRSATALAYLTAAAVRAAFDQLDGFTSAIDELGSMACHGFAVGELVWRDAELSIPVGGGRVTRLPLEIVGCVKEVYQRNIAFDIVDDSAWLCLGVNNHVPIVDELAQKFVYVAGPGAGPIRFRGYGWANQWLSYLDGLTLEKFGTLVEVFGLSTPYLQREDGFLSAEEHAHAIQILEDLGNAQPAIIPSRYGKLDYSPVPSGLAPIHQSMLGYIKTEQSKMVLGSTLAVEIGAVGSQAAATVHADGLVDTQRIYASRTAEALRSQVARWFLQANSERLAAAFSRYVPGGCSPADVEAELPILGWIISDETPTQRVAVFQQVRNLGYALDEEQVRAESGVLAPLDLEKLGLVPSPPAVPTPSPAAKPAPTPGSETHADAEAQ